MNKPIQPWMREAARAMWPYAGTTPLQSGDSLREVLAQIIANHCPEPEGAQKGDKG